VKQGIFLQLAQHATSKVSREGPGADRWRSRSRVRLWVHTVVLQRYTRNSVAMVIDPDY